MAPRPISPPRSVVAQLADSLLPELRRLEVGADWSRKVAKVAKDKRLEEEENQVQRHNLVLDLQTIHLDRQHQKYYRKKLQS